LKDRSFFSRYARLVDPLVKVHVVHQKKKSDVISEFNLYT